MDAAQVTGRISNILWKPCNTRTSYNTYTLIYQNDPEEDQGLLEIASPEARRAVFEEEDEGAISVVCTGSP